MAHESEVEAVARAICLLQSDCDYWECTAGKCVGHLGEHWRDLARAAIAALDAARAERGIVLVPREPTEAMLRVFKLPTTGTPKQRLRAKLRAMLSAIPTPDAGKDAAPIIPNQEPLPNA